MAKVNKGLDIEMAELKKDVAYIKESQYKMDLKMDKLIEKLERHIEDEEKTFDDKYANKWTEKALIFAGSTIAGIIITAIMYTILK